MTKFNLAAIAVLILGLMVVTAWAAPWDIGWYCGEDCAEYYNPYLDFSQWRDCLEQHCNHLYTNPQDARECEIGGLYWYMVNWWRFD